jgi:SAM-dependent methyltransferase
VGVLAEQLAYYRALGLDYEDPTIWRSGSAEVVDALDAFRPTGDVLELACGTGLWTRQLLRHATSVTAVDAAPEMLAIAAGRFGEDRVRFVEADGRVFFIDDAYRTPEELVDGASSSTIRRRLDDGRAYRIVKVPYQPRDLEDRLGRLGRRVTVSPTSGPLFWRAGAG